MQSFDALSTLDGRRERKVYTILDGKTPEELVKATEELPGPQRRVDDQKQDLRRIDQRMSTLREVTDQILANVNLTRGDLFADTVI